MSNGIGNKKQTTHKVALYTFSPEHKKNTLLTACGVGNRKSHWRYGQQKKNANNRQNQRHRSLRLRFSFFFFFFSHSLKPKRTKKKQSCATTTTDSTSHSRWYAARWNSAASTFPRGFLHRSADGSAAARSFRRGDDCAGAGAGADADLLPPLLSPLPVAAAAVFLLGAIRFRIHSRTLLLILLPATAITTQNGRSQELKLLPSAQVPPQHVRALPLPLP